MADRVQTPLMMLHNDQDDAVPWYQGIEYYMALRRLDKEVYLLNYNGELHGLRKRANQKDYTVRMQQYFDHFLKDQRTPEWMEKGIPFIEREQENLFGKTKHASIKETFAGKVNWKLRHTVPSNKEAGTLFSFIRRRSSSILAGCAPVVYFHL